MGTNNSRKKIQGMTIIAMNLMSQKKNLIEQHTISFDSNQNRDYINVSLKKSIKNI